MDRVPRLRDFLVRSFADISISPLNLKDFTRAGRASVVNSVAGQPERKGAILPLCWPGFYMLCGASSSVTLSVWGGLPSVPGRNSRRLMTLRVIRMPRCVYRREARLVGTQLRQWQSPSL